MPAPLLFFISFHQNDLRGNFEISGVEIEFHGETDYREIYRKIESGGNRTRDFENYPPPLTLSPLSVSLAHPSVVSFAFPLRTLRTAE